MLVLVGISLLLYMGVRPRKWHSRMDREITAFIIYIKRGKRKSFYGGGGHFFNES